jgi:hypothetical protein
LQISSTAMRCGSIRAAFSVEHRTIQGTGMNENDNEIDDAELARLGIRRIEKYVFQRGEYIYSNLRDAIAAAKRDGKS